MLVRAAEQRSAMSFVQQGFVGRLFFGTVRIRQRAEHLCSVCTAGQEAGMQIVLCVVS
jgi:hypothetical protein